MVDVDALSLAGISNKNVTQTAEAKNRPVPHNKTDVPPKQKSDNYDDYDNKFLDELGNLLGPTITD